jgi:hypothetical protein
LTVERILFDSSGTRFVLPELNLIAPGKPGREEYITAIQMPEGMMTGLGRVRIAKAYKCNPIHYVWPVLAPILEGTFYITPGGSNGVGVP